MSDVTECVDSDASGNTPLINLTRKRKSFGRVQDAAKKIRNHTYETGKPCYCKRFKCFSIITDNQRKDIITRFNKLHDRNEQNNHLCGLIGIQDIKRRRPRKHEPEAILRDNSFVYKVRVLNEVTGQFKEVQICQLAFINLHDFNIGFGYPRSDTCSYCDATKVKVESLESKLRLVQSGTEGEAKLKADLKRVEAEAKLHKLRAATFYIRKRIEKKKSRTSNDYEAITMDYCKNLPTPNITTNDVYYKRELTFISFNIHVLSSNQSVFYTYPQTIAKKGADLYDFCIIWSMENKESDKDLVHGKQRFDSIEVIFPMRGHSYLESDKDFGLINQKAVAEVPSQWVEIFKTARVKPRPFNVYECTQEVFHAWTKFLSSFYRKTCPLPTRPLRVLQCTKNHPRTVALPLNAEPNMLYHELLPIPKLKYQQLQELKELISEDCQSFYENLARNNTDRSDDEFDLPLNAEPNMLYHELLPIPKLKYQQLQELKELISEDCQSFYENLARNNTDRSDDEFDDASRVRREEEVCREMHNLRGYTHIGKFLVMMGKRKKGVSVEDAKGWALTRIEPQL
ncbi:hypothetical protein QE152_g38442 [Popillia japonica]|uniref:Uncharacterized protein n=1 Tax=Popillia japonica TaxID=7064 RepID=A0AAW1HY30_POPJA